MVTVLSFLLFGCKDKEQTYPDLLVFEKEWLDIPYDDPMDPRTVKAVLGIRHIEPVSDTQVRLEFGASWSGFEPTVHGFEIYSPNDPNYVFEDFVNPTEIEVISAADTILPLGRHAEYLKETHVYLTLPHALESGKLYYVRATGGQPFPTDFDWEYHNCDPWFGWGLTNGQNARGFMYGQNNNPVTDSVVNKVMGLRGIYKVTPTLYKIRLGSAVDETLLDTPEQYTINGVTPLTVHRFSEAEATLPGLNGVYPFMVRLQHHDIYLRV